MGVYKHLRQGTLALGKKRSSERHKFGDICVARRNQSSKRRNKAGQAPVVTPPPSSLTIWRCVETRGASPATSKWASLQINPKQREALNNHGNLECRFLVPLLRGRLPSPPFRSGNCREDVTDPDSRPLEHVDGPSWPSEVSGLPPSPARHPHQLQLRNMCTAPRGSSR